MGRPNRLCAPWAQIKQEMAEGVRGNLSRPNMTEMNGWSSSPSSSRGRREATLARAQGVGGELPGHRRDLAMGANGREGEGEQEEGRGAAWGGRERQLEVPCPRR